MTIESLAINAALTEEERNHLQADIQQLEAKIQTVEENIRGINAVLHNYNQTLPELIALGDECLTSLDEEEDVQTVLNNHKFCKLLRRIDALTSCKEKSEAATAINDFLKEKRQMFDTFSSSLMEEMEKHNALEAQLAEKRKLLESTVEVGEEATRGSALSGLELIKDAQRIRFKLEKDYITLLDDGIIPDIAELEDFDALDEAWQMFNGLDNETIVNNMDDFIDEFLPKVPTLHKIHVKIGWNSLKYNFDFADELVPGKGEMLFQQSIYTQFTSLFFAAANENGWKEKRYKTNQRVQGSLSFLSYETVNCRSVERRIAFNPHASVTLGQEGWDAFGMMVLKATGPDPTKADTVRCVLMTAITALAIKDHIAEEKRRQIAIPFVLAEGLWCSLFVTTLDDQGVPRIKVVKLPGTDPVSQNINDSNLSSIARKHLFVALAVLLNNMNNLFDDAMRKSYDKNIEDRRKLLLGFDTATLQKETSDAGSDPRNPGANCSQAASDRLGGRRLRCNRPTRQSNQQSPQEAHAAASLGGIFTSVKCAFERNRIISTCIASNNSRSISGNDSTSEEVAISRFYFKARMVSPAIASMTKDVFLKVWNEDIVDVQTVEMEWIRYKVALDAGVPVAAPALPAIVRSTSPSGSNYLVFAVEYIQEDPIHSVEDLVQFSASLIQSVVKLHDAAGLLHCDLKPANIRWRNGVVRLIDFGYAQQINLAVWVPGTKGYQAPEIVDQMPCSVMTDAFSVGRTILEKLEGLRNDELHKNHSYGILKNTLKRLTDPIVDSRWSLQQALGEIHNKTITSTRHAIIC